MSHVVRIPPAPFLAAEGALRVTALPAAEDNLVWLLECVETGAAAIVDGPDATAALAAIAARGIKLVAVLNTHTHPDHIGVNADLQVRGLLSGLEVYGPALRKDEVPGLTHPVDEGDLVVIGKVTGRVLRTEGHTGGAVSFLFGDALFCGDTLFAGGCGRVFDSTYDALFDSLMRLARLPDHTKVCCAHEYTQDNLRFAWTVEPDNDALAERIRRVWDQRERGACTLPSRLEEERATNPFLRPGSPTIYEVLGRALPGVPLETPAEIFAATRKLKDTGRYRVLTDDRLPL